MVASAVTSELVKEGTKTLGEQFMNALASGASKIGLEGVATELGKGGLSGLYGGLDALVGGVLPMGQDIGAGYLANLYTGADKLAGGRLPNFAEGFGYIDGGGQVASQAAGSVGADSIGSVMPGGTTSGAGQGGFDVSSMAIPGAPTYPNAMAGGGTHSMFQNPDIIASSNLTPSSFMGNVMSYAKPALGLAGAVAGIARALDDPKSASEGGRNAPAGSRPNSVSSGLGASQIKSPSGGDRGSAIALGGNKTGASDVESTESEETNAVSSEIGEDPIATRDIEMGIGMDNPADAEAIADKSMTDLLPEVVATESAVEAEEEAVDEEIQKQVIQQLVTPANALVPMGNGAYKFNPVTF